MPGLELKYKLTPTQQRFVDSEAVVNVIYSNTGEGKTFASIASMLVHAQRCKTAIRCAIVRDTHENIKTSIVDSIHDFFKNHPGAYRFRDDSKELSIFTDPPIMARLFGIDDPGSLSKLQGPEYALVWLNEPAPMSERSNAGIAEEVFNAALLRCTRQKGTIPRLQVDMNPADEAHWTYRRFLEDDFVDPENALITKAVFRIPYGENVEGKEIARQAARMAYKDDPAGYARYVEGRFAPVQKGIAVTPHYKRSRHMLIDRAGQFVPLIPAPGLEAFAFFDSWANPACVLGQITQYNRLVFLDTLFLPDSDVETLLETKVIPLLESPRWKGKSRGWRIGGDPTMLNMDQSSKTKTAAKMVEKFFPGCRFEPGFKEWKMIEPQINWALTHNDSRGEPLILLSGDNKILDRALSGGWHYAKNNAGERASALPVKKDPNSHPGDAWAAAVCRLLPSHRAEAKVLADYRRINERLRQRAQNYSTRVGR